MKRLTFLLPYLPLMIGALALILLPILIQPEIVISFRLGLGAVLFLIGLIMRLWIQALAVVDSVREKKAQAETETATRDTEEGHRRFIRRLDHELKNPLTTIQAGLANLAEITDGTEAQRETLSSVEAQTLRLSRLAADLRKLAELETYPLERTSVSVANCCRKL